VKRIARLVIDECRLNWQLPIDMAIVNRKLTMRVLTLSLLVATFGVACGRPVTPPVVTAPRFPDYLLPTLPEADPRFAGAIKEHDDAWRWFQSGDLSRAESGFQAVLKKSPQFYPSVRIQGKLIGVIRRLD